MAFKLRSLSASLALAIALTSSACTADTASPSNPYTTLCEIYEQELAEDKAATAADFQRLNNRISDELPELMEPLHHISNMPPSDVYPTIRTLASQKENGEWYCEAIERVYSK